jgi:carboxyl-terminal processing protease
MSSFLELKEVFMSEEEKKEKLKETAENKPEEKPDTDQDKDEEKDDLKIIKMKRHLYPEEIVEKKTKKKIRNLKIAVVAVAVSAILIGWLGGSIFPFSAGSLIRNMFSTGSMSSSDKISSVLQIMENDWYFGSSISDLDERLTDQALEGITDNDEDTHTSYMTADEMESFTQSINRNYVGIGVQIANSDGSNIVEKVFKDSPAESAGVKAGDIFYSVDGKSADGLSSAKLKKLVQGDEGTNVTIEFKRDGKIVSFDIARAAVSSTVYGEMLDDNTAYLQLYQFGQTTPDEVKAYLDDFQKKNAKSLVIDLRDNGGGYLDSVSEIAGCFLPKDSVVLKQEYSDGTVTQTKTSDEQYTQMGPIVILVNKNTASAAEVLTLALKQQRSDVTIVGMTTYGKGTVQVTKTFSDGSALKYTTSKWLSPNDTCINGTGITPDDEVKLADVFYQDFAGMDDDETFKQDSVGDAVSDAQKCLSYLGYTVDRTDGYFSVSTQTALTQYQTDHSLTADGVLNHDTYESLSSAVVVDWNSSHTHDTQLQKAEEILNG